MAVTLAVTFFVYVKLMILKKTGNVIENLITLVQLISVKLYI